MGVGMAEGGVGMVEGGVCVGVAIVEGGVWVWVWWREVCGYSRGRCVGMMEGGVYGCGYGGGRYVRGLFYIAKAKICGTWCLCGVG